MESGQGHVDWPVSGTHHASCQERGMWQPSTRHRQECSSLRHGRMQRPDSGTAPGLPCPISKQHYRNIVLQFGLSIQWA